MSSARKKSNMKIVPTPATSTVPWFGLRRRQKIPVRVALVVDEVWRVPVGRPLYDPGLALLALQVQRALVGAEGPERGRGIK